MGGQDNKKKPKTPIYAENKSHWKKDSDSSLKVESEEVNEKIKVAM